jgi:UDP-glucose 4-epimerase
MVREISGSQSPIEHIPYNEAYGAGFEDLERRVPDTRKLEKVAGYKFSRSLEQIIADVVAEQRSRLALR